MGRPGNVYEYDAYPSGNIPADRKPLPKEEEDRLIAEMKERIRNIKEKGSSKSKRKVV